MDELNMERTNLLITLACNLNCARCGTHVPYAKNSRALAGHFSIEYLQKVLDRYFKIVTHVWKFTIAGGEPLLHPDLPEFLNMLQPYAAQIDVVEIITNGTILPNEKLIQAAKGLDKLCFLVDDYGRDLSRKIPEIEQLLTNEGIKHVIRENNAANSHCGGWMDYGDLRKKRRTTREECEKVYAVCSYPQKQKFAFSTIDGMMYPCTPLRLCREFGVLSDNYDEYINLFDDAMTVEEQRQKIKKIYGGKSLSACAFCDGWCEDSVRYVPAVQLTPEELRCVRDGARSYHEALEMLHKTGG